MKTKRGQYRPKQCILKKINAKLKWVKMNYIITKKTKQGITNSNGTKRTKIWWKIDPWDLRLHFVVLLCRHSINDYNKLIFFGSLQKKINIMVKYYNMCLNTTVVFSKISFENIKTIKHLGQKYYQECWAICTHYTKRCKVFVHNFERCDTFYLNFCVCCSECARFLWWPWMNLAPI